SGGESVIGGASVSGCCHLVACQHDLRAERSTTTSIGAARLPSSPSRWPSIASGCLYTGWRAFRRDVQVIFQDPYGVYNPFYRVDHVLTTPVAKFGLATSRAGARRLIDEALRAVGLRPEETLGRFPHQLSGGQRQRVMVARALLL